MTVRLRATPGRVSCLQACTVEKQKKTTHAFEAGMLLKTTGASPWASCCERRRATDFADRSSFRISPRFGRYAAPTVEARSGRGNAKTPRLSIMLMIIKAVRVIRGEKRKTPMSQKVNSLGRFCRSRLDRSRGRKMKVTSIMLLKTHVEKMSEQGLSIMLLINNLVNPASPLC